MKYLFSSILCGLFFLVFSLPVKAETVYKQVDNSGSIVYTDTPPTNGNAVDNSENISTVSTPKNIAPSPASEKSIPTQNPAERKVYSAFSIQSPKDQDTLQNERELSVELALNPELQEGDKIQLVIDGTPYGSPSSSTHQAVGQLNRGSHQISAVLMDKNNNVLKQSGTITVYVHYAAIGVKK